MEHPTKTDAPAPMAEPTLMDAAASPEPQSADLVAEERSEDDGMREHAQKASDPVRWAESAARRTAQARGPVRRRTLGGRAD
jgi:hypothetical protein